MSADYEAVDAQGRVARGRIRTTTGSVGAAGRSADGGVEPESDTTMDSWTAGRH